MTITEVLVAKVLDGIRGLEVEEVVIKALDGAVNGMGVVLGCGVSGAVEVCFCIELVVSGGSDTLSVVDS